MRKIKIAMIVAVLMSLVGIATAADVMNITQTGTDIDVTEIVLPNIGDSVSLDVNISNLSEVIYSIHRINATLVDPSGNNITGVTITLQETMDPLGPKPYGVWTSQADNPIIRWNQTMRRGGYEKFDLTITKTADIPNGSIVTLYDYKGKKLIVRSKDSVIIVPEFPAMVIPVASVIGLMFIFHNKRKRA